MRFWILTFFLINQSASDSDEDEGAYSDEDEAGGDDDEDMEDIDEYGPDLYKDDDDRRRYSFLNNKTRDFHF